MTLPELKAANVVAGQPVTAQGWNDIVETLRGLHAHVSRWNTAVLRVRISCPAGYSPCHVRLVAVREGEPPLEAIRPYAQETCHILCGISQGPYRLLAEAPGLAPAEQVVEVPGPEGGPAPLPEIALSKVAEKMPALYGLPLKEALLAAKALNIPVTRLLDAAGTELAPANPGAQHEETPVLVQMPPAEAVLGPDTRVQLVVGTAPQTVVTATVPSLAGLTRNEAKKALEKAGLLLGKEELRLGKAV